MRILAVCFLLLSLGQDKPIQPEPARKTQKESAAPVPTSHVEQSGLTEQHVPEVKSPASQSLPEAAPKRPSGLNALNRAINPDTWPTWALVLVGIWAARIAIRTLKAIDREAEIATKIADAARANALALVVENRPWLLIDTVDLPYVTPVAEAPSQDQRFTHCISKTRNHGKTPAKVVTLWAVLRIGDSPMKPPVDLKAQIGQTGPIPEPFIFPPGETKAAQATLTPQGFISPEDRDAILKSKTKYLWFCGFVKYLDTFERNRQSEYETRFCYLYETRLNAPEPFWTLAGPPEYNGAT